MYGPEIWRSLENLSDFRLRAYFSLGKTANMTVLPELFVRVSQMRDWKTGLPDLVGRRLSWPPVIST